MMIQRTKQNEGIALLTATLLVAIASLVLGALSLRAINQNRQVVNYVAFKDSFQGLEAALAQARADLEQGGDGQIGIGNWEPPNNAESLVLPNFAETDVEPIPIASMPDVEFMAYTVDWMNDGLDSNGDGVVDSPDENWTFTIYSFARGGNVERRSESVLQGRDVNVWRNAIFGGTGQAGGLINGNVSIHGSVHLLGNDILEGGTAVTAIDLSGTALIHNNWAGMPADLRQRIPDLSTTDIDGESVETLEAVLRVKRGLVGMSGNSEIGAPQVTGSGVKGPMDGTFVEDGWTGNSVIDDGDRGTPTRVTSDNGWDIGYDLGDRVSMPVFEDDWREPDGSRITNPNTGDFYSHEEYFEVLAGDPYVGNVTIQANQDFYYNATRPNDSNPANRLPSDNYIFYDGSTKRMEMNGQIIIDGDFALQRGGGNDHTMNYTGRAAILVRGDVELSVNLLSVNADGSVVQSFPENNIFGIMAEGDMSVGLDSQLSLMGAFYAQNQVMTRRQSNIIGTFVSNYFDMGTNVPSIYQVPPLADNLPYGMIGAFPLVSFNQVSWREL